jgi:DNA-binding XRE family transcriptional regulator
LGLLQKEVAKQIGVSKETIYNWETNRTVPEIRMVPQIIGFLGYVPYRACAVLGERFAMVRQAHGFSRKELARKTGIDEGTLRN